MSLPIQASYHGRMVAIGHASVDELTALAATSPLGEPIDTLERWSLIAIRGLEGLEAEVHALGWRLNLPNAWITSALVAVDLTTQAIRTASGHVYRLGRADDPGSMTPDLSYHLDFTLRRWGFVDFRWGTPPD